MDDDELMRMADDAERDAEGAFIRRRRTMQDFRFDERQEKFWDITTGQLLGGTAVNGAIPKEFWPTRPDAKGNPVIYQPSKAINDVDTGLTVEGSTWWPGKPRFIRDVVVTDRGAIYQRGAQTYNSYVPPQHDMLRDDRTPDKWIEHVKRLYPDPIEHNHFFDFGAHMLQRPDEKINHGIVMAGKQGIGKDTALLPLRRGVGEWNAAEIEPDAISRQWTPYVQAVLLVINEVRPHDEDFKASNFYNQLKPLLAAPPEMLPMEVKYANLIYVRNLCHVVLTTNDPLKMYVPAEDRRLFIMTSPLADPKANPVFPEGYFDDMHAYLEDGGNDAVIRWLLARDISHMNVGAPPAMTTGKQAVIDSASQLRRTALDDALEQFIERLYGGKPPDVIFTRDLLQFVQHGPFFDDRDAVVKQINSKPFHFKMDEAGYAMVRNPWASEWRNGEFRSRTAFIRKEIQGENQLIVIGQELQKRPLEMILNQKF